MLRPAGWTRHILGASRSYGQLCQARSPHDLAGKFIPAAYSRVAGVDNSFSIGSCESNNRACQVTVKGRTTRLVGNHGELISALCQLENRIGEATAICA